MLHIDYRVTSLCRRPDQTLGEEEVATFHHDVGGDGSGRGTLNDACSHQASRNTNWAEDELIVDNFPGYEREPGAADDGAVEEDVPIVTEES